MLLLSVNPRADSHIVFNSRIVPRADSLLPREPPREGRRWRGCADAMARYPVCLRIQSCSTLFERGSNFSPCHTARHMPTAAAGICQGSRVGVRVWFERDTAACQSGASPFWQESIRPRWIAGSSATQGNSLRPVGARAVFVRGPSYHRGRGGCRRTPGRNSIGRRRRGHASCHRSLGVAV